MLLDRRKAEESLCLAEYTRPELIIPRLQERDLPGILGELVRVLHQHGSVPDPLPFYHAALNRECLAGAGSLCGIAFPHARSPGVRSLEFAFGRAEPAVPWNNAVRPVRLIFLIAIPGTETSLYLKLLASIARRGQRQEWIESLCSAGNPREIFARFYG